MTHRRLLVLVAVVFLAAHLPYLPATLEDLDSINFAMGVREFDLAKHQPHPPGYPVYIAVAKASTAAFRAAGVEGAPARGLALWGVIGGALTAFSLFAFFRRLEGRDRVALFATVLTMSAPLFWFTANRPLSDMSGLAVAMAAQALALIAVVRQRDPVSDPAMVRRLIYLAAAVGGLAIGVRSQMFLLTLPLVGWLMLDWRVPAARRPIAGTLAAVVAGVLVWAIPLMIASGGPSAYLNVLSHQGGEDFSGVRMLWTSHTVRDIAYALRDTFVLPWATILLATSVLVLAGAGALVVAWRSRMALWLIVLSVVPYAAFHLLFQETVTVRYALPLVPVTAYLAIVALDAMSARMRALLPFAVSVLIALSLATAMPALREYGRDASPVFRAFRDMRARPAGSPVLVTHWESKRPAEWLDGDLPARVLPIRPKHEWQAAVRYWRDGGRSPLWFLARPGRTDLALIDPVRRVLAGAYRWTFDTRAYVGGARPNAIDWYDITSPGWFLDTGWSLTPEAGGVTKAAGDGPHLQDAIGYIARRPGETLMMIGGMVGDSSRTPPSDGPVRIRLSLDERVLAEWEQPGGWFLRVIPLPAGTLSGDDGFARLAVRSSNSGAPISVKLEQFDVQPADTLVWGFDAGWMEDEYDPARELLWRWSGAKATFNIHNAGRGVTIRLRGDSPLKYFDAPPHVTVTAGGRTLASFSPDRDFVQEIVVPADALAASHGLVVLETDRTFQPPHGDPRVVGLKFFEISVR